MKTKHTPGPWSEDKYVGVSNSPIVIVDKNGDVICDIDPDSPEYESNAKLIAAAPELLKAIEGFLAIVDETMGVYGYHLNGDPAPWGEFDEVYTAVSAYKKATE